jgi:hypothetical protein
MDSTTRPYRVKLSSVALIISGVLFVLYPAIRPFSDEVTLDGAAAFASTAWLVAHTLAMVAFTLLPVGLLGLYLSLRTSPKERRSPEESHSPQEGAAYWALVLSILGVGFTLPFYGGETYGLRAIGQAALAAQDVDLVALADVVRGGAGLALFGVGLLLIAVAGILVAVAVWRSARYGRWTGVPLAAGLVLYLPQFFLSQPLRIAHGVLVAIGCIWLALAMWRRAREMRLE